MPDPRLLTRDIRKAFGPTVALGGVSFSVAAGRVHAVIGENGAGKSTLMNILAGATLPDSGELELDGAPYRPLSPVDARRAGVAMVHQELSLCPHLTVAENIALGAEPARFGFVSRTQMRDFAAAALDKVSDVAREMSLRPETRVGDLSPAGQQLVELARAVAQPSCRVLILDEPTSSLGARDTERLFSVIGLLRERGLGIVYISHFLEEVQRVADDFTVLRDGKTVGTALTAEASPAEIVELMAGRKVDRLFPRSTRTPGDVVLEVEGLTGRSKPTGASLVLRRGQVIGVTGLVGAGRSELLRAIFGLEPVVAGSIKVLAISGPRSPSARIAQGVGFVSEDRKGEGLAMGLSVAHNLTLCKLNGLGPFGFVWPHRQRAAARRFMERLTIRADGPDQPVRDLSGGNQQKVALARLLYQEADVYLLDEPTRGIDVASKAQIYDLIDELAVKGKAVLMVSSYVPELLGICDHIAVMRRGQLGPLRPAVGRDEHDVLLEATGT